MQMTLSATEWDQFDRLRRAGVTAASSSGYQLSRLPTHSPSKDAG